MKENNSVKEYSLFYFYVSPSCDAIINLIQLFTRGAYNKCDTSEQFTIDVQNIHKQKKKLHYN